MQNSALLKDFNSLAVKDLLDAREAYHVHLAHLRNVVATAIGRYRFHKEDPAASDPYVKEGWRYGSNRVRTLGNTVVRPWSWPCVLVFVDAWATPLSLQEHPYETVPRYLYLPDGRVVPTCVVKTRADAPDRSIEHLPFWDEMLGGGYPCYTNVQQAQQVGTLACLVRREGLTFALTNRHVAGRPGQEVLTLVRGEEKRIGESDVVHVAKRAFEEVYPGWSASRTFVQMDAGLVRLDDVNEWTGQAFGIGEVGPLLDMNSNTITLDLIGSKVRFYGAASGTNEGEIAGLFYRYRSVGGFDYVADVLIGPRTEKEEGSRRKDDAGRCAPGIDTRPGDSGALVFLDPVCGENPDATPGPGRGPRARRLRPLAMQWGGVRLAGEDGEPPIQMALATFLSTVCRVLDIDLLNDWNTGHSEYWGKAGHFKLGYKFGELLEAPGLRQLVLENRHLIGFPDQDIHLGRQFKVGRGDFVPLADVPDYVWIPKAKGNGGSNGARTFEPMMHFADMDGLAADGGKSLFEQCREAPDGLPSAQVFKDFFDGFEELPYGPEAGALLFRVRQIYEEMLSRGAERDLLGFFSCAGVLAHYVGDCCIPLHFSVFHHGEPPQAKRGTPEYAAFKKSREYRIHSLFEQRMFEVQPVPALAAVDHVLSMDKAGEPVTGGEAALKAVFELMCSTFERIPPRQILEADDPSLPDTQRADRLFQEVGQDAAWCLAQGCRLQARLVEGAWAAAGGDTLLEGGAPSFGEPSVRSLYERSDFLPAWSLETMIEKGY